MKISANLDSVQALRDLSEAAPLVLSNLQEASMRFQNVVAELEEGLGARSHAFCELTLRCVAAVSEAGELMGELTQGLVHTADQLELYLHEGERRIAALCDTSGQRGNSCTMNTPEEIAILRESDTDDDIGSVRIDASRSEPVIGPKHLPTKATGRFVGSIGDSLFVPSDHGAIEYLNGLGFQGVEYRNGYPDFMPFAQISTPWGRVNARVDIGHMTPFRRNPAWDFGKRNREQAYDLTCDLGNFNQADIALAEKLLTVDAELVCMRRSDLCRDIAAFRKDAKLTWHECADGHTMLLIPSVIHRACPHSGGVSFERQRAAYGDVALDVPGEW